MTEQEKNIIAVIRSKQDPEHAAKVALEAIEALVKKRALHEAPVPLNPQKHLEKHQ